MENLYCTIFIVDVSQNPEEVETVSSRIQQLIEDHGGIIKRNNPWGKQKLAYPIQNKNYGFYVEIEFTANSHLNIPKTIEQEYRINDRVLRHLTYVVTKKELQQRQINAERMKEEAQPETSVEEKPPTESETESIAKSEDVSPRVEEVEENVNAEDEGSAAAVEIEAKEEEKRQEQEGGQETQESADVKEEEEAEKEQKEEEIPVDKKE